MNLFTLLLLFMVLLWLIGFIGCWIIRYKILEDNLIITYNKLLIKFQQQHLEIGSLEDLLNKRFNFFMVSIYPIDNLINMYRLIKIFLKLRVISDK